MKLFVFNHIGSTFAQLKSITFMKNIFILLMAFATFYTNVFAQTQIPNGNFESWSGNKPASWGTSDEVLQLLSPNVGGVTRETNAADVYEGTSAALLTTKNVNIPTVGSQNIPGVVSLGTLGLNFATFQPEITGLQYTDRPDSISFAYKYEAGAGGNDAGSVIVTLTRFANGEQEFVANAFVQLAPTSAYTVTTAKIEYFTFFNPDTLLIQGLSTASQTGLEDSKLWLDDLKFVGLDTAFKAYIRPFQPAEACEGEIIQFSTDDISGNTYEWFKDNVSIGSTLPSIGVTAAGNYHVKVIRNGMTYYSDTISASFIPAPTVSLSLSLDSVCTSDPSISLVGSGNPAGGEFSGPGVSGNDFSPSAAGAGNKQITYTYTDGNDCSAEATDILNVRLCTGIEIKAKGVEANIYPNPTTNFVVLDVNDKLLGGKTVIVDATGKVVTESTISKNKTQINTRELPTGNYFIKIMKADGKLAVTGNLSVIK
jgi:hypothetical protein